MRTEKEPMATWGKVGGGGDMMREPEGRVTTGSIQGSGQGSDKL